MSAQSKSIEAVFPDRLTATLSLDEPVRRVRLVNPARAGALESLGISTVRDLLFHFPRRYIDLSSQETILSASIGQRCTIAGAIHEIKLKRPKPKLVLVEIALVDETGVMIVTAFRQPWLMDQLKVGMHVAVAGKLEFGYGFKRMTNPFIEVVEEGSKESVGKIIPVHPATEKMSTAWIRRLVNNALACTKGLRDPLPLALRTRYRLMSRGSALACIHFPHTMDEAYEARRRLAYEELLMLELYLIQQGRERSVGHIPVTHTVDGPCVAALSSALPFTLTDEQEAARDDILRVMAQPRTANHMLLGDVGTGKTVVAAFGLAAAVDSGGQAFLMAPTEVLAQQHRASLGPLFDAAGVTYDILTGSTTSADRMNIVERFAQGAIDVLIGTHALLEEDVIPKNLTFVVIDEQQRFGVDQRSCLLGKGQAPDALYLSATPIPRTLALALFGNLSLSYIRKRPHDTAQRLTKVYAKQQRGRAYDAAVAALARGEQVYVVCPLVGKDTAARNAKAARQELDAEDEIDAHLHPVVSIEDEADLVEDNVAAALQEAKILQQSVFIDYTVELLHGKMSGKDKQAIMERFRQGEIQVLVATTVIEVGVDVHNATIMIIEDADRFGLSQLHQLRGRVGRGEKPGEVYLISASKSDGALARLAAMESTDDGYELAAFDLSLRREGDILGNRQHGASALRLVNVIRDGQIIEAAHHDAEAILDRDPKLESPNNLALAREIRLLFKSDTVLQGG